MLELDRVAPFLLDRGLIAAADVVDGGLSIVQVSLRNRHFRVERERVPGWFIKQPGDPALGGLGTLRNEAGFHLLVRERMAAAPAVGHLPTLVEAMMPEAVLIFERIADAVPLHALLDDPESRGVAVECVGKLGAAMGAIHRAFDGFDPDGPWPGGRLLRGVPHAFRLHEPHLTDLARLGPGAIEAIRILQGGDLGGALDRLGRRWRPSTLIHGDVKFDNVLARKPGADGAGPWIVDWEMVQHGDPAWDLAGALQDFVVLWVNSMPMAEELSAVERVERARIPLSSLRPTIAALWSGYRRGAGLSDEEAPGFLRRAVGFSAARLLQSAFEWTDDAVVLPGPVVLFLQIAANLLADPGRGQVELYGLPADQPSA